MKKTLGVIVLIYILLFTLSFSSKGSSAPLNVTHSVSGYIDIKSDGPVASGTVIAYDLSNNIVSQANIVNGYYTLYGLTGDVIIYADPSALDKIRLPAGTIITDYFQSVTVTQDLSDINITFD